MKRSRARKRPLSVTVLLVFVLWVTIQNGVRFGSAIAAWDILREFATPPGPLYIALTGLFWALAGSAISYGLYLGRPWARRATAIAITLYMVYYWLDRLLVQSQSPRPNWPLALAITVYTLGLTAEALALPRNATFFTEREHHER